MFFFIFDNFLGPENPSLGKNPIENYIQEFEFINVYLRIAIPISLILLAISYLFGYNQDISFVDALWAPTPSSPLFVLRGLLIAIYFPMYLAFLTRFVKFTLKRFNLSRNYIKLFSDQTLGHAQKTMNISYLIRGLNHYNKFLKQKINLQIRDIEKVYSKIASSTPTGKKNPLESMPNDSIESIAKDLVNEFGKDKDILAPARYLGRILKKDKTEEYLTKEPFTEKIKGWNAIFAAMIPAAAAIIVALLKRP